MLAEQILQLIVWFGVVLCIPATYRFAYAAFGLLWRKLFPTNKLDITLFDEESGTTRTVHLKLKRNDARSTVKLLAEALEASRTKS